MINTDTLKTTIIDLAVSGKISSGFDIKDSVTDIISVLPAISNKRKNLLEQKFEYGKQPLIPPHWKWTRLGEITTYGDTPTKACFDEIDSNTWLLDLEDIKTGGEVITKTRVQGKKFTGDKSVFRKDQVLYSKLRPYLKKVLVADEDGISTPELISFDVFGGIIPQYIVYCLLSTFTTKAIDKRSYGIKMPRVDAGFMVNLPIPLPPVSEQQYIVARVQAAFAQIDTIDKLQAQYSNNLSALKSKLVDLAVQGKLTKQLSEDGTAEDLYQRIQSEKQALINQKIIKKDKDLPLIEEEERLFEIPKSWKWVHLGDLFQHNTGKALNSRDNQGELFEYITTSNVYWDHFVLDNLKKMLFKSDEVEKCTVKQGDLLVCEGGDIGRAAIWPYEKEIRIQNHIHRLRGYNDEICAKFYYYILWLYKQTGRIDGVGIGLQGFSSNRVHSLVVPLAPYKEQLRIVEMLDSLCSFL